MNNDDNLDLAEKIQIDTWAYFNCLESNFAQLDQRRIEVRAAGKIEANGV